MSKRRYVRNDGKRVKITATCDEREELRRALLIVRRYSGPNVIIVYHDGTRIYEHGLPSVVETLKHYGICPYNPF